MSQTIKWCFPKIVAFSCSLQIISEDPDLQNISDDEEDEEDLSNTLATPDSLSGEILAVDTVTTYISCPLAGCNFKKLQVKDDKLQCPACSKFFPQSVGSLQVVAKLLVDHNGNVLPLTFFTPALKTLFQKLDRQFHLTSDIHHLKQQLLALVPTTFSFVAKNNVISKVVSAKRSSDSD